MTTILVTGGAGFVGSNLCLRLRDRRADARVIAFDNLKRRGSELALARLRAGGCDFVHGDVRIREDLFSVGDVDLIIDCAAEPSVLAGVGSSPDYVIQTNLGGTTHCLELARRCSAAFVFLSTSRVYPVRAINELAYEEEPSRFSLAELQETRGASSHGIAEDFPLEGVRSIYGASKLASEYLVQEYADAYGVPSIINRCGVLTGPWQMGKVDQGVVVLWIARHLMGRPLSYIGFGGAGKQVRDALHIDDLHELLELQLAGVEDWRAEIYNVGGGRDVSVSLAELTELARSSTGQTIEISAAAEDRPNDLISYISDARRVREATGWRPRRAMATIVEEITRWIVDHRAQLEAILG